MREGGTFRESLRFGRGDRLDVLTLGVGEMGLFRMMMRRVGGFGKGQGVFTVRRHTYSVGVLMALNGKKRIPCWFLDLRQGDCVQSNCFCKP